LFRDLLDELYVSQKLGKLLICRDYSASKCRGHISVCRIYIYICYMQGESVVLCRTPRGTVFMPLCKIY